MLNDAGSILYWQRQQIQGEIQKRQNAMREESRKRREEAKQVGYCRNVKA